MKKEEERKKEGEEKQELEFAEGFRRIKNICGYVFTTYSTDDKKQMTMQKAFQKSF